MLLFLDEGYVKMYLKGRPITMYMPRDLVDTYCLEAKADLPPKKLKLDWVYPLLNRNGAAFRLILVLNVHCCKIELTFDLLLHRKLAFKNVMS